MDVSTIRLGIWLLGASCLTSVLGIALSALLGKPADPELSKIALATGSFLGGILVNPRNHEGSHWLPNYLPPGTVITVPAQVSPGAPAPPLRMTP